MEQLTNKMSQVLFPAGTIAGDYPHSKPPIRRNNMEIVDGMQLFHFYLTHFLGVLKVCYF